MRLLTPDAYATRRNELDEAREKAVAAYRSANLAAELGSGTDAEIRKAKADLDAVEARIDALQSARVESQRIQAVETRQARQAAYAKLSDDAERLLAEREATIARIEAKARDLGEELAAYDDLTLQMRSAIMAFRPYYQPENLAAHVASNQMKAAFDALVRQTMLAPLVVATMAGDQRVLEGHTISDREAGESAKVRSTLQRIAPERELA